MCETLLFGKVSLINRHILGGIGGSMKKNDMELPEDLEFWDDTADEPAAEADYDQDDYDNGDYEEDDFDREPDLEENLPLSPKKIVIFAGIFLLAVVICIPLWMLTHNHLEKQEGQKPEESAFSEEVPESVIPPEEAIPGDEASGAVSQSEEDSQWAKPTESAEPEGTTEPEKAPETAESAQGGEPSAPPSSSAEGGSGPKGPVDSDTTMNYYESNDSVTAKDVTNLRRTPTTSDEQNVVGQLKNGQVLSRKGFNDETGWSVLEYNGETVYAVTTYLTTDLSYKTPVTAVNPNRVSTLDGRVIIFADCDDYITPKEYVNLRTEPSTSEGDSTVRVQVNNGEKMHRTGYSSDSGWSRVEYNGETLYVVSSLTMNVEAE